MQMSSTEAGEGDGRWGKGTKGCGAHCRARAANCAAREPCALARLPCASLQRAHGTHATAWQSSGVMRHGSPVAAALRVASVGGGITDVVAAAAASARAVAHPRPRLILRAHESV